MGKMVSPPFLFVFDPILFILAGNEDMHKISDEFEFRPDRTTDYGVSCPWASKKFPIDLKWEKGVSMLACSLLIESSSKLLVTKTGIKARTSLILGLWFPWPIYMLLKWVLTLAYWTQVSDRCPLGYLFIIFIENLHNFLPTMKRLPWKACNVMQYLFTDITWRSL